MKPTSADWTVYSTTNRSDFISLQAPKSLLIREETLLAPPFRDFGQLAELSYRIILSEKRTGLFQQHSTATLGVCKKSRPSWCSSAGITWKQPSGSTSFPVSGKRSTGERNSGAKRQVWKWLPEKTTAVLCAFCQNVQKDSACTLDQHLANGQTLWQHLKSLAQEQTWILCIYLSTSLLFWPQIWNFNHHPAGTAAESNS